MQPKLTEQEQDELQRLLRIIRDGSKLPGQRRIASAKFDRIYEEACKRTAAEQQLTRYA